MFDMCVCVFGVCSAEDMEDVIQTSSWAAVVAVPQIYQNPKIHCFIMMFPIKMAVWWYTPFQSHQNTHIWLVIYSPYIYPYKYIIYIYISLYTHSINHHFIMFFPLKSPCYCFNYDFSLLLLLDFSGKFCPGKTGLCNKRSSTKPKSFASHGKKLWARRDGSRKRVVFYMGFLYPLEIKGGYCWEISCMVDYYKWI